MARASWVAVSVSKPWCQSEEYEGRGSQRYYERLESPLLISLADVLFQRLSLH